MKSFLERVGADLTAKYVGFKCADRYYGSLDMPSALHPQTILALDFGGVPLPLEYGYPLRVRVPTKLGFKSPKHIVSVFATNDDPGGYGRIRATIGSAASDPGARRAGAGGWSRHRLGL